MSAATTTAVVLLIAVPIAFNTLFALLGRRFDYPDILREPAPVVLGRFDDGGAGLRLLWLAFALTAVAFAPLAVMVGQTLGSRHSAVVAVATATGVMAAVVQAVGLVRWPFAVPHLARIHRDPASTEAERAAATVVFDTLHRFAGVAVGEHLGYLLTGAWTVLTGVAALDSDVPAWLGPIGIVCGAVLVLGSFEFAGRFEPHGWKLAGAAVPVAYVVWSLWLVALGVALAAA